MKILLVEDDPVNRDAMAELLRMEGHEVEPVVTALEFVSRLLDPPADAVVLDVRLNCTDGLALLAHMREKPAWAGVPAVLATADPQVTVPPGSGPTTLVLKSYDVAELLAAIARVREGG